ncbi:MAG: hypothetical protein ABI882_02460 [Acidobacteriota bacterium]
MTIKIIERMQYFRDISRADLTQNVHGTRVCTGAYQATDGIERKTKLLSMYRLHISLTGGGTTGARRLAGLRPVASGSGRPPEAVREVENRGVFD